MTELQKPLQQVPEALQAPPRGVQPVMPLPHTPPVQEPLQQSRSAVQEVPAAWHEEPQRSVPVESKVHRPPQHSSPKAQVCPSA